MTDDHCSYNETQSLKESRKKKNMLVWELNP